jgi:hypothetical protein
MEYNIITTVLFSSFLAFTACKKSDSVQEDFIYHPSENTRMTCTVDGEAWKACGIFLSVQHMEISHRYLPEDPEYGKLALVGNRFDSCDSDIDYDYNSIFSLRFYEGAITNDIKTIDLKDNSLFKRAYFSHWGEDSKNNFEDYYFDYDHLIDGELKIDSLLLPDAEKELHGKIWCSFWMDLSLSEQVLAQEEANDTIKIRNGQFNLTTWWD